MIISRTPFRISFFGGGTDYPAWYRENGGQVLATTINRYCYISCRYLPPFFDHRYRIAYSKVETTKTIQEIEHPAVRCVLNHLNFHETGLEIHNDADLPARSGLGSSSAFTVGLLNALTALRGESIDPNDLAHLAIHIEQNVIQEHVGSQDQTLAAHGGFNHINFETTGHIGISPVILKQEKLEQLQQHLMLFFTGFSRFASDVAKSKIDNFKNKKQHLHTMHDMVGEATNILQSSHDNMDEFGVLLDQTWQLKRDLSGAVSTPQIDMIYETAKKAGATGGKLLGAGGGGFMLLFVKPELQEKIKNALQGLLNIPFSFESEGSRIVLYQPEGL